MRQIFTGGKFYTADDKNPISQAIVIDNDKFTYVGTEEEALKYSTGDCKMYDLNGRVVIPGFIDSHVHPGALSASSWHIRLPWTESIDELLSFIKDYAEKHPKEEIPFLYFEYYPTSMFGAKGPTKELLDTVVSDRPCLCQDFGDHLHWVNSKMLAAMGVDKNTPDPVENLEIFVRDERGNPTGWVKEMAWLHFADQMWGNIGWKPAQSITEESLLPIINFFKKNGVTAIAEGVLESEEQIKAIYQLDKKDKLNLYYDGCVRFYSLKELPEKIAECKRYNKQYGTKHIKFNTMKLFLDGTNEAGNSASLHPHVNDPTKTNYGEIKMEVDELTSCFIMCNENEMDLHIHMVGDRAFRVGCDAVEKAQGIVAKEGKKWVTQPIFAHCEIVDPKDMDRPAKLGITINWSCHWSGGYFGEEALNYFTYEKWARMYQFNPIIDSGALVSFSSDVITYYELHRAAPFFSMQVAATRVDPEFPLDPERYEGSVRPPFNAKLSKDNLFKGYTINGSKQLKWANIMGSIEPGKIANFNIISQDLFQTRDDRIKEIEVEATIFEGKLISGEL